MIHQRVFTVGTNHEVLGDGWNNRSAKNGVFEAISYSVRYSHSPFYKNNTQYFTFNDTDEAQAICSKYGIEHEDGEKRIMLVYRKIEQLRLQINQDRNRECVFILLLLTWENRSSRKSSEKNYCTKESFTRLCHDRSILHRILKYLKDASFPIAAVKKHKRMS